MACNVHMHNCQMLKDYWLLLPQHESYYSLLVT